MTRARTILSRGCIAGCLGMLVAFALSMRWTFGYTTYTAQSWYCVVVSSGALRGDRISTAFWSRTSPPRGFLLEPTAGPIRWVPSIAGTQWQVPLWVPFVLLIAPTVFLWRRAGVNEGRVCTACGYPLAGLPPRTRCPECGV